MAVLIFTLLLITREPHIAVPASIRSQLSFKLHYPTTLPGGYAVKASSVTYEQGVLFFQISGHGKTINVSQQPPPDPLPAFAAMVGFSSLDLQDGKGYMGDTGSMPTVFIVKPDILVTLSASPDTPDDLVSTIAQSFRPVSTP